MSARWGRGLLIRARYYFTGGARYQNARSVPNLYAWLESIADWYRFAKFKVFKNYMDRPSK